MPSRARCQGQCLTPAFERARLTYLATIKDVNKGLPLRESMVGSVSESTVDGLSMWAAKWIKIAC